MKNTGFFTISLDFELYWGVRHITDIDLYEENIKNVHTVIPRILEIFEINKIRATWCIVGFLFFENKEKLLLNLPAIKPTYEEVKFDPYLYISNNNLDPIYHFAPDSIRLIKNSTGQEIGTHTFSHYFCLESGQSEDQFYADLKTAIELLQSWQIKCDSIIFPRNQYTKNYLDKCQELGVKYYRGSEKAWYYQQSNKYSIEKPFPKLLRLLDAYFNLSGFNTYSVERSGNKIFDVPASKFLRPYNPYLKYFENIRFNRIATAMTYAAKNKRGYHLWWHPHNFGKHTEENLLFLKRILDHFATLNKEYGFTSKPMNQY